MCYLKILLLGVSFESCIENEEEVPFQSHTQICSLELILFWFDMPVFLPFSFPFPFITHFLKKA